MSGGGGDAVVEFRSRSDQTDVQNHFFVPTKHRIEGTTGKYLQQTFSRNNSRTKDITGQEDFLVLERVIKLD